MAGELGVRACVSLWELVLGLDSIVRLPLDARFTECATNEIAGKAKSEGKQRQVTPVIRAFGKSLETAGRACVQRAYEDSGENWVHGQAGWQMRQAITSPASCSCTWAFRAARWR